MGCSCSKPRDEQDSPYDVSEQNDESLQAINADTSNTLETPSSHPTHLPSSASRGSRRRDRIPTTQATPASLHPHVWTSKRQWTRSQLIKERQEFFETRVTGHHDIWETLKVVVELLANGDVELAQSVVDAAEILVPTGDLKNGAYDSQGVLYQMPEHIISDPVNVVYDQPNKEGKESSVEGSDEDDEVERRRVEKGKGIVTEEETVKVMARLSDRGGPDIVVQMLKGQAVRWLIRRIQEDPGVNAEAKIKVAYMGKILKENRSLQAQGWREGHVVNALVF